MHLFSLSGLESFSVILTARPKVHEPKSAVQVGREREPHAVRSKGEDGPRVDLVRLGSKKVDGRSEDRDVDESRDNLVEAEEELRTCKRSACTTYSFTFMCEVCSMN